ncbi:hypothetical protein BJF78_10185 [Pseudonocardia sp. CNS-139]|nr:hypothetical protein BJF78_10185 [Pseudonocardia sp. CNS-139]
MRADFLRNKPAWKARDFISVMDLELEPVGISLGARQLLDGLVDILLHLLNITRCCKQIQAHPLTSRSAEPFDQ